MLRAHRFFQQWTGINAILYYAPTIFKDLGLSDNTTSLLASGVVGVLIFLFTIPAVLYVDRLGRKPILIVGAIGMATWYAFKCSLSSHENPVIVT
jgi:MFS family permease